MTRLWPMGARVDSLGPRRRATLEAKARAGDVAGGPVYGYRSVRNGTHADWVKYEPEAAVVRRIFQLCAEGHGTLGIAKKLNAEGVPKGFNKKKNAPRRWN